MTLSQFVQRKMSVAEALNKGQCGGSYVEGCIITGALLSAIAADLWPGTHIDQFRFVELWTRFGWDIPDACHISVPLLVDDLRAKGRKADPELIEKANPVVLGGGSLSRTTKGKDVDRTDQALLSLCPQLTKAEVRKFSYPCVFYREIRSALVHEYKVGSAATLLAMDETDSGVSYIDNLRDGEDDKPVIHFGMSWLTKVISAIAKRAESVFDDTAPLPHPPVWWLREG